MKANVLVEFGCVLIDLLIGNEQTSLGGMAYMTAMIIVNFPLQVYVIQTFLSCTLSF